MSKSRDCCLDHFLEDELANGRVGEYSVVGNKELVKLPASHLHMACETGNLNLARRVIEAGCDVNNNIHSGGMRPLGAAIIGNNPDIIDLLIANGADVNYILGCRRSTLIDILDCNDGDINMFEKMISVGADVDVVDINGNHILAILIDKDKKDHIRKLIKAGLDINTIFGFPCPHTLIHSYAKRGDIKFINELISMGADAYKKDVFGNSPVGWAASANQSETFDLLFDQVDDDNAELIICKSLDHDNSHIFSRTVEKFRLCDVDLLLKICLKDKKWKCAEAAVKLGADPGARYKSGDVYISPLVISIVMHQESLLKTILSMRPDLINDLPDERGQYPLYIALVNKCSDSMVRYLIAKGADVNNNLKLYGAPIHAAVCHEFEPKLVDLLLSKGADVNAKDATDHTALYYAQENKNKKLSNLLIKRGGVRI